MSNISLEASFDGNKLKISRLRFEGSYNDATIYISEIICQLCKGDANRIKGIMIAIENHLKNNNILKDNSEDKLNLITDILVNSSDDSGKEILARILKGDLSKLEKLLIELL